MPMFTTIAAAAGLAGTAVSTGMSFAQAGKQRNLQAKAEAEAEKSMAEAKKQLSINYSAALGIQKEPYQLEREALISAGAQAIEAGREGERGAAETAGRVYALQQQGQQQIASEMGQELTALDKATAAEAAQLRNARADLSLQEAEGAQLAARDAQEAAQAATMQGIQGVASTVQQAASFAPLYQQNKAAQQIAIGGMSFTPEQFQSFGNVAESGGLGAAAGEGFTNLDLSAVSKMTSSQYSDFVKALTPAQKQILFNNKQYTDLYNPFNPFKK